MKGFKVIVLCFIVMVAMMCTSIAAEIILTPDKIVDKSAGVVAGSQIRTLMHGEYVAFDVDLTGMHSITMQVEASLSGNYDGDIYEIRLGSPKGSCISRINVNSEETEYFTSHMVAQSGVKRVYIKSLAGLEDGCIFKSIKFSSDVYVDVNNSRATTRNGVAFPTSPLIIHADHPYIPVSALISAYGLKATNLGDANYMMFSTNDIVQIAAGQIRDKLIESKSSQGINGGAWLGNTVEANFIANNAPHHYEWVTSKFPNGP